MRAILGYAINMIPYMIITAPIYCVVRFFIMRNKKINRLREVALFLFVLFAVGLASQTVIPKLEFGVNGFGIVASGVHKTNLMPFKVLTETYNEVFVNGNINYFLINFLGNIILFIPFGFVIPALWKINAPKVVAIGFFISLFIELCQMFLTRGTDVDDLMLNTLGTFIGLLIYRSANKLFDGFAEKLR